MARRSIVIQLGDLDAVEYERQHLPPFIWRTVVRFRMKDGTYVPKVFVPMWSPTVIRGLDEMGVATRRVQLGSTEPHQYRPEDQPRPATGVSTWRAIVTVMGLVVFVAGAIWLLNRAATQPRPDWRTYAEGVIAGDELAVRALLCDSLSSELDATDFETARADSLNVGPSPIVSYRGQRRGGPAFLRADDQVVVHDLPWRIEEGQAVLCPESPAELLGTPFSQ